MTAAAASCAPHCSLIEARLGKKRSGMLQFASTTLSMRRTFLPASFPNSAMLSGGRPVSTLALACRIVDVDQAGAPAFRRLGGGKELSPRRGGGGGRCGCQQQLATAPGKKERSCQGAPSLSHVVACLVNFLEGRVIGKEGHHCHCWEGTWVPT